MPVEADPVLVLRDQRQEARQLGLLAREVGVEQRLVALAAAPQHVVHPAQPLGGLEHHLDLRRGVLEHVGIRVRRGAGRVARVAEQVRGAPQQLRPGARHVPLDVGEHGLEVRPRLGEARPLRRHVPIVEAEERRAELLDELEGRIDLVPGGSHRVVRGRQPGSVEGPGAEHVGPGPVEGVPQADRDAEVVLHALARDEAVRLVDLERERLARGQPAELDPVRNLGEEASHAHPPASSTCPPARLATVSDTFVDAKWGVAGGRPGWADRTPGAPRVPW